MLYMAFILPKRIMYNLDMPKLYYNEVNPFFLILGKNALYYNKE